MMADDSKCGQIGNEGAAAQKPNVVLKAVDMDDEMRSHAVPVPALYDEENPFSLIFPYFLLLLFAFQEHAVEKNIAEHIKKEFDARYGQSWHCIVGRNFGEINDYPSNSSCACLGSFVTHESKHFIYLYVDSKAVLLFKSG
ncbi:hypothetical protein ZIOFF_046783 [Zingiber officinale]|uniref:Dynein light chain n=1 Tax=Zingiber officinale TaxID=94328 RepID=A0A8J5G596_ZINOF|nr:hypothetical protein ZIOFF_046783 [Zingiber officinale]